MFLSKIFCAFFFLQSANVFCGVIAQSIEGIDVENFQVQDESIFEEIKKEIEFSGDYEDLSSARNKVCKKIGCLPKAPKIIAALLHFELNELHAALNAAIDLLEQGTDLPEEIGVDINVAIGESKKNEKDRVSSQKSQESKAPLHFEKTKKQTREKRKCEDKDPNPNPFKKGKMTCKVKGCHKKATKTGYCETCREEIPTCHGVNGQRCDNIAKHRGDYAKGQKIYCPSCKNLAI